MSELASKAAALAVIAALEARDLDKFDQAFKSIDDEAVEFLERFLIEVASGKYEVFKREDAPQFHSNPIFARAVLRAWQRVGNARGKMGARMAFETAIDSTRRNK